MSEADIMDYAHSLNISFEFWDFAFPILAVYWRRGNKAVIGLSKDLKTYPAALRRCIIAEELGHHFTCAGPAINYSKTQFHKRLYNTRLEYQAQKWAALFLLPGEKIIDAYNLGIREPWEMAEFLEVTVDLLNFRLKLPDLCYYSQSGEYKADDIVKEDLSHRYLNHRYLNHRYLNHRYLNHRYLNHRYLRYGT